MHTYLYCRVEAESSGREDDSPIVVLFTGISQSVVKNLKQVYSYLCTHKECISVVTNVVTL